MDTATILGVVAGLMLVLGAIALRPGAIFFIDVSSMMIVFGGVIGSTLINFPAKDVLSVFRVLKKVFMEHRTTHDQTIERLVKLAEVARREGILSIERHLDEVEDDFMRRGLQYAVDGTEPDHIRTIMESELASQEERHRLGQGIFQAMATYAPAFGLIGTVIGLIQMLRAMDNPDMIGKGMATALVTTFYGAMMAYALFLPIAGKLYTRSNEERQQKELMLEGILAIQSGDNPRIVREKLLTFLSHAMRTEFVSVREGNA
jgi:chemotaxis protein MotA